MSGGLFNNEKHDLLFLGMDLIHDLFEIMSDNESDITDGMTVEELRAFHLALDNVLGLIKVLIEAEEQDFVIIIPNQKTCEYTVEDLCSYKLREMEEDK